MVHRRLTLVQDVPVTRSRYCLPSPWEHAIDEWITWLTLGGLARNTLRLRREHIRSIARRSKADHPRLLTLALLIDMTSAREWSNEYRRSMRTSLVSFCDWCVSHELMGSNVALLLPAVPGSPPRPRPAPDDIWDAIVANAAPRELLMARLGAEAGMRRSEIAQARRDDLVRDGLRWSIIVHGKGGRQRVIPLTDSLAAAIQEHTQHGYLFPGPTGGHISAPWVGSVISRLMPPGWTLHKLRHRYASRGYQGTRDIFAVQKALGHRSVATTQLYVAISEDDVRRVTEAASDLLNRGRPPAVEPV